MVDLVVQARGCDDAKHILKGSSAVAGCRCARLWQKANDRLLERGRLTVGTRPRTHVLREIHSRDREGTNCCAGSRQKLSSGESSLGHDLPPSSNIDDLL